jgi:hypothetical protein
MNFPYTTPPNMYDETDKVDYKADRESEISISIDSILHNEAIPLEVRQKSVQSMLYPRIENQALFDKRGSEEAHTAYYLRSIQHHPDMVNDFLVDLVSYIKSKYDFQNLLKDLGDLTECYYKIKDRSIHYLRDVQYRLYTVIHNKIVLFCLLNDMDNAIFANGVGDLFKSFLLSRGFILDDEYVCSELERRPFMYYLNPEEMYDESFKLVRDDILQGMDENLPIGEYCHVNNTLWDYYKKEEA